MITPTEKQVEEFLIESNKIERVYQDEFPFALEDSKQAWITGVLNFKKDFSIDLICGIHRRIMKKLNPKIAGKIRTVPIYVGNSISYRECLKPELIKEELRLLLNPGIWPVLSEEGIKRWHIKFESIHPFEDGNGRTGRMIMNLQRLSIGLPLLIIHEGQEQQNYYQWFKELK